jgi:hypothetical protein
VQELPSSRLLADVVFLCGRTDPSPALLVELKWDRKLGTAIAQTLDRDYPEVLRGWGGPMLLVGIAYSTKSKEHSCRIVEA